MDGNDYAGMIRDMDRNDYVCMIQRLIDKTYKLATCDVSIAMAKSVGDTEIVERWKPIRDERGKEIVKLAEEILSDLPRRP